MERESHRAGCGLAPSRVPRALQAHAQGITDQGPNGSETGTGTPLWPEASLQVLGNRYSLRYNHNRETLAALSAPLDEVPCRGGISGIRMTWAPPVEIPIGANCFFGGRHSEHERAILQHSFLAFRGRDLRA